ncbi:MAG: hypothetical protein ACFFDN_34590 [Candidatus Hodarchaeota archaeon]
MPLDKEKLDVLLKEIEHLKQKPFKRPKRLIHSIFRTTGKSTTPSSVKKDYLLPTEKKTYFEINHFYRLIMLSIGDMSTAIAIWINGVLPLLLSHYGLEIEEWERICNIGDQNSRLVEELNTDWIKFFQDKVEQGQIDPDILTLINQGKLRVDKMRTQ